MDATLKGLVGLLDEADAETRCAALLVLTRLGSTETRVVRSVARLLASPNVVLRDFALGYFEALRPLEGVAELLPFLDAEETPVRERVVATLVACGPPAVAAARKLVGTGPRRRLHAVVDLFARVHSSAALDVLFGLVEDEDVDVSRIACEALLGIVPGANARLADDLFSRTRKLVSRARNRRPSLVGAAKLFGAIGKSEARMPLFAMLEASDPPVVRTHALAGLTSCLREQKLTSAEIERLLPLLDEDDEAGILRPTVRLLQDQNIDRRLLPLLNRLADSANPLVKRFAVQKLGAFDSAGVVNTLIGYLTDDSYARRAQAIASLKTLPAARAALMKEFLACEDERRAWTLQEILLLHDRSWRRPVLDNLWTKLETAIHKRDDRLWAPYLDFLRALDGDSVGERVRNHAERHRKAKRFAVSARWLALIKESPGWDDEDRFAFAVASVKSHPPKPSAVTRRQDAALAELRVLADSAFPLGERLRRERALEPDELYAVAFHLAEGRGEQQSVARDLLEHLANKHPRAKVGKAARNKRRLLGS